MAQKKTTEEKILTALRRKAQTKGQLAETVGASHSHVSALVNALVSEGKVGIAGEVKPAIGRPAPKYAAVRA